MSSRLCLALTLLFVCSIPARGQGRKEVVILFKDGFSLSGKVVEQKETIFDPASGVAITVPLSGGLICLDDLVRRIYFIPGQLQDVRKKLEVERDKTLDFRRYANTSAADNILPGWTVVSATPWNKKWERALKVHVVQPVNGFFNMDQRIVQLTPYFMRVQTLKYNWDMYHLTKEFSPEYVRDLLNKYLADKKETKDLKEWDKRKTIAAFFHQAGWHKEAQQELDSLVEEYASQKEGVAGLRDKIKKILADQYVDEIKRADKNGQHQEVRDRLAVYAKENMAGQVNEDNLLLAQELKNKYAGLDEKIAQAKALLAAMPKRVPASAKQFCTSSAELILQELNFDTLGKLETFLTYGQQHLREAAEKAQPSQSADEVMALAVSGWLLGNASAEADVKNARLLMRAREMVLEYQKTVNTVQRAQMLTSALEGGKLSVDVLARIIKNLPPPAAYDNALIGSRSFKLEIDIADSKGGSYYVQLPPGYHHQRSYPVLLLLHSAREKADAMMERMSELAAQHGFILAAPLWSGTKISTYSYSATEHAIVLDALRDLRRRFQVDSDRVFLLGFDMGADAALDIGMGHPDQFAGCLSMCGAPRFYSAERDRYQSNAQYLPFYLVEGDRNGANAMALRWLFKIWASGGYPALYAEYKGRGLEWYAGELPRMFDWMSGKKRHHPLKEMGRRHSAGGVGEEFRTMRECDNRFYWLSTDAIDPRFLASASRWVRHAPAATMLASLGVVNEMKGWKKDANVVTQFNIQTKGLQQVTLWLAPEMVDLSKPIRFRVNGSIIGGDRVVAPNPAVLMEDFYYNGDRQRLWFANVPLKF